MVTSKAIRLIQARLGGMVIRVERVDDDGTVRAPMHDSADALFGTGEGEGCASRGGEDQSWPDP